MHLPTNNNSISLLWHWLAYRNGLTNRSDVHTLWNVHSRRCLDYVWLLLCLNWYSRLVCSDPDIRSAWGGLVLAWADSLLLIDVHGGGGLDLWCGALVCDIDGAGSLVLLWVNRLWLLLLITNRSDLTLSNHSNTLLRSDMVIPKRNLINLTRGHSLI